MTWEELGEIDVSNFGEWYFSPPVDSAQSALKITLVQGYDPVKFLSAIYGVFLPDGSIYKPTTFQVRENSQVFEVYVPDGAKIGIKRLDPITLPWKFKIEVTQNFFLDNVSQPRTYINFPTHSPNEGDTVVEVDEYSNVVANWYRLNGKWRKPISYRLSLADMNSATSSYSGYVYLYPLKKYQLINAIWEYNFSNTNEGVFRFWIHGTNRALTAPITYDTIDKDANPIVGRTTRMIRDINVLVEPLDENQNTMLYARVVRQTGANFIRLACTLNLNEIID